MKKLLILLSLLVVIALAASPALALIGGELDTEHTNVGAVMMLWTQVTEDPFVGRLCTATLIHEQVLVTAAHCYPYFVNQGIGYDGIWISFDQAPLENQGDFLAVQAFIPHPDYTEDSRVHDVALVILESPVTGGNPANLPVEGYLDNALGKLHGIQARNIQMTIVGYGATALWPQPNLLLDAKRWVGTTTFVNLQPLRVITSNSDQDDAIICYGDSGGPIFWVNQAGHEVLVGVHSSSTGACEVDHIQTTLKTRLDTADALDFIYDTIAEYFSPE